LGSDVDQGTNFFDQGTNFSGFFDQGTNFSGFFDQGTNFSGFFDQGTNLKIKIFNFLIRNRTFQDFFSGFF